MTPLLFKIIPLDLAATLSPGILALSIVLLGSKYNAKLKVFALLVGVLITGLLITALGFFLGVHVPSGIKPTLVSAIVDLLLAAFFFYFGFRTICTNEKHPRISGEDESPHTIKWLIVGFLVSLTNLDAVFLTLTATKEVSGSSIEIIHKIVFSVLNLLFFILPVLVPVVLFLIFPHFAKRFLGKIDDVLMRYSKYIVFILFIVFAIYFSVRGLKFFV